MNDPIILRQKVRAVLAAAGRRPLTEELIAASLVHLGFRDLKHSEMRTAIEWNHGRNLVEFTRNDDLEVDEWSLTLAGKTKEGLA